MTYTVIGSKIDLNNMSDPLVKEFYSHISDILENPEIQRLDTHSQHINTSRLQHSINVAYYTFLFCRKKNLRTREATRAALLHDFFLYDWKTAKLGYHPSEHPRQALINAKKYFEVTDVMEDAIVKHMWPISLNMPHHKEGWVVTMADKLCATMEVISSTREKIKQHRYITVFEGPID